MPHATIPCTRASKAAMKRTVLCVILIGMAAPAWALRCGNRLVGPGDQDFQVRDRCGAPLWIERTSEYDVIGANSRFERQRETPIEVWTYNFGPNTLMRRLVLRNGVVAREETLGYGVTSVGDSCNAQASYEGFSVGELVAHCGEPLSRRSSDDGLIQRPAPGLERWRLQRREDLIYDFGDNLRLRRYRLVDGRVVDSDTLAR